MYTTDKKERITLRLNPAQFSFVKKSADELGVSPSDFLRMVINSVMYNAFKEEGVRRENEQADINDKL